MQDCPTVGARLVQKTAVGARWVRALLTDSLRLVAPFATLFGWTVACFGSLVNLVLALGGDFIGSISLEAPLTTFDRSCL